MKLTIAAKCFGAVLLVMSCVEIIFGRQIANLFEVSNAHSILHLVTAVVALSVGFSNESLSKLFFLGTGILNGLIALTGFMTQKDQLFGMVENSSADAWMHLAIAAVAVFVGKSQQESAASDETVAF